ncbi:hypothetical protein HRbin20_01605 [bacterium HR20]|nr:hypothetical protein HRbin20_01605 [bacterium HR20]
MESHSTHYRRTRTEGAERSPSQSLPERRSVQAMQEKAQGALEESFLEEVVGAVVVDAAALVVERSSSHERLLRQMQRGRSTGRWSESSRDRSGCQLPARGRADSAAEEWRPTTRVHHRSSLHRELRRAQSYGDAFHREKLALRAGQSLRFVHSRHRTPDVRHLRRREARVAAPDQTHAMDRSARSARDQDRAMLRYTRAAANMGRRLLAQGHRLPIHCRS